MDLSMYCLVIRQRRHDEPDDFQYDYIDIFMNCSCIKEEVSDSSSNVITLKCEVLIY